MMIETNAIIGDHQQLVENHPPDAVMVQAEVRLADANRQQADAALKLAVLRHARLEAMAHRADRSAETIEPAVLAPSITIDFCDNALVYIVDHDAQVRSALCRLLAANGLRARAFADGATFLVAFRRQDNACLLADTALDDHKGLALLLALSASDDPMSISAAPL